jgi:hypothetical protein
MSDFQELNRILQASLVTIPLDYLRVVMQDPCDDATICRSFRLCHGAGVTRDECGRSKNGETNGQPQGWETQTPGQVNNGCNIEGRILLADGDVLFAKKQIAPGALRS